MNNKLLITDIISFSFGLILLCIVQLMMIYNPLLLTSEIVLICFAVLLIVFCAFIIVFSYTNNTESISLRNCLLHLVLGILIYGFYSTPVLGFVDYYGLGNSICIAFVGVFCSKFAFSFSKYAEIHNITGKMKINTSYVKLMYSRNNSYELFELLKIVGFIVLIICTIGLIINTLNPCFNIALPIETR